MTDVLSLESLFSDLSARGLPVHVVERKHLHAVIDALGKTDLELPGSRRFDTEYLRDVLRAVIVKDANQLREFEQAYARWLRIAEAAWEAVENGKNPFLGREPPRSKVGRIALASEVAPRVAGKRIGVWIGIAIVVAGAAGFGFLYRDTKDTPPVVVTNRDTHRDTTDADPNPSPIANLPPDVRKEVRVPRVEVADLPAEPLTVPGLPVGLWVTGSAVLVILAQVFLLRAATARRLAKTVGTRHALRAPEIPGDTSNEVLLDPSAAKEMTYGVERFVDDEFCERIDLTRTVAATVKSGGAIELVRERPTQERSIWLFRDSSVAESEAERLEFECARRLERSNLTVRRGRYHGVPEVLHFEDVKETSSLRVQESCRESTIVLFFTDGVSLLSASEKSAKREELGRLFRELAAWPRLAFVCVGEGLAKVRALIEGEGTQVISPIALSDFIGMRERSAAESGESGQQIDAQSFRDWEGALALRQRPFDPDAAWALRGRVAPGLSPFAFRKLQVEASGCFVRFSTEYETTLLRWLIRAEDHHRSGSFTPAKDSLLVRAVDFWRGENERERLRAKTQREGAIEQDRVVHDELLLRDALLELWIDPAAAAEKFEELASRSRAPAIRAELRHRVPRDLALSSPGVTTMARGRDSHESCDSWIVMPWSLADVDASARSKLVELGFASAATDRHRVGIPFLMRVAALTCLATTIAWWASSDARERAGNELPPVLVERTPAPEWAEHRMERRRQPDGWRFQLETRTARSRLDCAGSSIVEVVWKLESTPNPQRIGELEVWRAGRESRPGRPGDEAWPKRSLASIVVDATAARERWREYARDAIDCGLFDAVTIGSSASLAEFTSAELPWAGAQWLAIRAGGGNAAEWVALQDDVQRLQPASRFAILDAAEPGVIPLSEVTAEIRPLAAVWPAVSCWPSSALKDIVLAGSGVQSLPTFQIFSHDPASKKPSNEVLLEFVILPSETFRLGSPESEEGRYSDEGPVENVHVESFAISRTEITRRAWREVMGKPPKNVTWAEDPNPDAELPANRVNWFDALEFCNALSRRESRQECYVLEKRYNEEKKEDEYVNVHWNRGADGFRLPIEAEWEYAARAGTTTPYPWEVAEGSDGISELSEHAWWSGNTSGPTPVGTKPENRVRLYDMIGNVREWCWDQAIFDDKIGVLRDMPSATGSDGSITSGRVVRGGSFVDDVSGNLRSACRFGNGPENRDDYLGFRCVAAPLRQHDLK